MLCDWSSFQYTTDGGTAAEWYEKVCDKIILADDTRDGVESLLEHCEGL